MSSKNLLGILVSLLAGALLVVACGNDADDKFECCYNDQYYDCPNEDELNKCAKGEDNKCERKKSKDSECTSNDDSYGGY